MANGICDVCGRRYATYNVKVNRNGNATNLELCDQDYAKLKSQQPSRTPYESIFSSSDPFGQLPSSFDQLSSNMGNPLPRETESINIEGLMSDHTKELIQKAAETAVSKFGRTEVDTEHLLYALTESDVVAEILKQFKLKIADVKGYINENAPKDKLSKSEKDRIEVTVSPRVKQVIEKAFQSSQSLGHNYIGPEHLLIGLTEEDEGMAGDILRKYGLTPESIRQKTVKVVGKGAEQGQVDENTNTPQLDKYSRDLSALAKTGKLDPVIGRAKEIETSIEILARRTKNNPVLIGEPGVGKTAIIEGLAQRIVSGKVPQVLQDKRVIELNLNSVLAGSKYRGEFEERMKAILDEITDNNDELIIFIDELHTIVGAGQGGDEGGLDAANVLKPSLARGELHLMGATTLSEYQKHIEKDAALERRFQPVFVAEPTIEQTIEIIRGLRDKYEAHHKIKITDEAITSAAQLSDRYISNRFLPDKAIDLIDQAASRVRILTDTHTQGMEDLDDQISKLKREIEYFKTRKNFDNAKRYSEKLDKLKNKKEKLAHKWRQEKGVTSKEVLSSDIAEVVAKITGIPVSELTEEEKQKLLKMEERLHDKVIGQEEAVRAVSDAVRVSRAGLSDENQPIATMLFLGPTGVGKTELAKALAWVVFGDEEAVTRIDMSEYMERHSVARLIGAPPGYVGYTEGGQLTEKVRRRPYTVLLLDEIEKAHPDVYNVLLQVFDDGRLTDGKGRVVDFSNTIIIATSNVGAQKIQENLKSDDKKDYESLKDELMGDLRLQFKPEFINRIDEIIVFHALDEAQIKEIVELMLERVRRSARGQGIELVFEKSIINHLAKVGYVPEFGARELQRKIKTEIENKLAKEILSGKIKSDTKIQVKYSEKKGVNFSTAPKRKKKPSKKSK